MKSLTVKVSPTGRMHLPAEVRRALGIKGPGQVVLTLEDGAVRLRTMAQTLERIRSLARPYRPKGRLASEQLIMERRAEAEREERDG
jgi:AbrB family looped-hinge helix DNA binding protein